MITISFYPKFRNEDINKDATIATYREWLEAHGDYGRLFMWDIGKLSVADSDSVIRGVRIFEDEVGTVFKLTFQV